MKRRQASVFFKMALLGLILVALWMELMPGGVYTPGAFAYFTIQSNLLVALCLLLLLINPSMRSGFKIFLVGTALVCVLVTGVIYNFVLYNLLRDWGTAGYTFPRTVTHLIAPLGFTLDFLLFAGHGRMKWRHLPLWLLYPMAYWGVSVAVSARSGISLYFFMDPTNGVGNLLLWGAVLLGMAALLGGFVVGIDQLLLLRRKRRWQALRQA